LDHENGEEDIGGHEELQEATRRIAHLLDRLELLRRDLLGELAAEVDHFHLIFGDLHVFIVSEQFRVHHRVENVFLLVCANIQWLCPGHFDLERFNEDEFVPVWRLHSTTALSMSTLQLSSSNLCLFSILHICDAPAKLYCEFQLFEELLALLTLCILDAE